MSAIARPVIPRRLRTGAGATHRRSRACLFRCRPSCGRPRRPRLQALTPRERDLIAALGAVFTHDAGGLDGLVDGADYGVIDNSVQFPGTSGYALGLNAAGLLTHRYWGARLSGPDDYHQHPCPTAPTLH